MILLQLAQITTCTGGSNGAFVRARFCDLYRSFGGLLTFPRYTAVAWLLLCILKCGARVLLMEILKRLLELPVFQDFQPFSSTVFFLATKSQLTP